MGTTALATKSTAITPTGNGLIKYGDDFDPELQAEMVAEAQLMQRDFRPVVFTATPGGVLQFTNKQTKDLVKPPLTGVILAVSPVRAFWAEKNGEKIPFCSSSDCVTGKVHILAGAATWDAAMKAPKAFAHPVVKIYADQQPLPDSFNCDSCPLNRFGSAYLKGDDTAGKGCQERRLVLMLLDGWHAPVIVSLAPGSLSAWQTYYSSVVSEMGIPYFAVRTELSIKKATSKSGIDYAQASLVMKGKLTPAEMVDAKRLRSLYKPLISPDTVISDADYYMGDSAPPVEDGYVPDDNENPF